MNDGCVVEHTASTAEGSNRFLEHSIANITLSDQLSPGVVTITQWGVDSQVEIWHAHPMEEADFEKFCTWVSAALA